MVRYISLLRFTEQGAKNIKKSTARAQAFDQAAAKAGVAIEAQYWTMGAYDGVLIISAESETQALHCLAQLAAAGNVRTETLPAFDAKQFAEIVGR
jgi:uncharacterized protein with GYD domain